MENTAIDAAKIELMKDNDVFRDLVLKHQSYEQRLAELAAIHYPTEDEQLEESTLKKKKLVLKDQMYAMLEEYSISH